MSYPCRPVKPRLRLLRPLPIPAKPRLRLRRLFPICRRPFFFSGFNASIIQGSVVGPPSFVIVASGLHPKHHFNLMTKYADDTYLMVGFRNIGTVIKDFSNIQAWASRNNLRIHPNKTKEMIVYRRRSKCVNRPAHPLIPGAERVDSLRVLGVVVTSHLTIMRVHLDQNTSLLCLF